MIESIVPTGIKFSPSKILTDLDCLCCSVRVHGRIHVISRDQVNGLRHLDAEQGGE